jgi:hypothetical protein
MVYEIIVRKQVLLFLLILFHSIYAFGQGNKQEKEIRIPRQQMPQKALELLQPFLDQAGRVRYYHETDGVQQSYECKFRHQGRIYSVEFTEDGRLEDVEVVVNLNELPDKAKNNITEYLEKEYARFIIRKIQKQFTSDDEENPAAEIIEKAMKNKDGNLTIRYELEVDGKQDLSLISHEVLFDHEGLFIQKRKIIRRQVDNILY